MALDPLVAFQALVRSAGPKAKAAPPAKFVKKLDEIPTLELSPAEPCRLALTFSETALIGKFTGLWPSPKAVEAWAFDRWEGDFSFCALGRGYFLAQFSSKEHRDLIFRSGPYFMGTRGLYLAPWTLDFNPEVEITAAPVWVRLPHLPLHLWGKSSLEDIGNKLGRFLDSAEPKGGQFACARICVEVNLEKGLPEALKLSMGEWSHIQELDYEQIPFKCLRCHAYGHFVKSCPKAAEDSPSTVKDAEFQTVSNRRRPPRRKETSAKNSEDLPPKEADPLVSKNSFEALQEVEIQDTETEPQEDDVKDPEAAVDAGTPEKDQSPPSTAASLGTADVEPVETSLDDRKDPTPSDSKKDASPSDPGTERSAGPSPPLTRGRKSNRERREGESYSNILKGHQKTLVPFLKGKTQIP